MDDLQKIEAKRSASRRIVGDRLKGSSSGAAPPGSAVFPGFSSCIKEAIWVKHDVLGSPEKDVDTSTCFKAIGAQLNSSEASRSRGLVCVSSPPLKRLRASALSCKVARLPVISRSLAPRLAGYWTSVLLHRRCLCCLLDKIYGLGVREAGRDGEVLDFSRLAAQEIVLCSALSFVAGSDVSVPYLMLHFTCKGAVASRKIPIDVSKVTWLGGDQTGAYTKLDNAFAAALRARGLETAFHSEDVPIPAPSSGLDFAFDFVEICGGSAVVSQHAARLGLIVCTPIELSDSPHFNLENPRLLEWIV